MEYRYFVEVVLPLHKQGEIIAYEMQKVYELQAGFEHNGKNIKPITYIADFVITYKDGHVEVIDTKGFPDPTAKLKRKLFWYKYPNLIYRWIGYSQIDGGWCDYEDIQKGRAKRRREKKKKLAEKEKAKLLKEKKEKKDE